MEELDHIAALGNISYKLKFWINHMDLKASKEGFINCKEALDREVERAFREAEKARKRTQKVNDYLWKNKESDLKSELTEWCRKHGIEIIEKPSLNDLEEFFLDEEYKGEPVNDQSGPACSDPVHPDHYKTASGWEVMEIVEELLTDEQLIGALLFQIWKYTMRAGKKTPSRLTDYKKAQYYLDYLVDVAEKIESECLHD